MIRINEYSFRAAALIALTAHTAFSALRMNRRRELSSSFLIHSFDSSNFASITPPLFPDYHSDPYSLFKTLFAVYLWLLLVVFLSFQRLVS